LPVAKAREESNMAGFDYLGSRATADKLIKKFGMKAVLRRTTDTPSDRPCWVVIIDELPRDAATELTNPTDRRVIMAADGLDSEPPSNEHDQLVTFIQPGGTIQNEVLPFTCPVKKYAPAGITVAYEFTVRR
jgi:hypothetical protein